MCPKYGISDAAFYKWRSKYGGLEVSEAKRLRSLEVENAKLNRLLVDAMLDVSALKEMRGKTSDAQDPERSGGLGDEAQTSLNGRTPIELATRSAPDRKEIPLTFA